MPTATVSKKNKKTDRFVTIPRKEYEELLSLKKVIPVVKPTKGELHAIALGRKDFQHGNYISWQELKHELAHRRIKPRKKTA